MQALYALSALVQAVVIWRHAFATDGVVARSNGASMGKCLC